MLLTVSASLWAAGAVCCQCLPKRVLAIASRLLSHQTEPLSHLGTDIESSPPFELSSPDLSFEPPDGPQVALPALAHALFALANALAYAIQGPAVLAAVAGGLTVLDILALCWTRLLPGHPDAPAAGLLTAVLAWPTALGCLSPAHGAAPLLVQGALGWLLLAHQRRSWRWYAVYGAAWAGCVAALDAVYPTPLATASALLVDVLIPCILVAAVGHVAFWVTEEATLRRLAAAERHEQEVQQCLATKSGLLGTLAHEVRTPLNAMLHSVALLVDTGLDPDQLALAACIRECGEQVNSNVSSVLEFLRLRHRKVALRCAPFNPEALCTTVLGIVRPMAQRKGVLLKLDSSGLGSGRLIGDDGRLKQVLCNLLTNSIKFVAEGHVLLRATMDDGPPGSMRLRFEVQDTGCGISPADQCRLFAPFQQAGEQLGGSGLGLCISKELVALMGGAIGIDPERTGAGVGSCFYVDLTLPMVPGAFVPNPAADPLTPKLPPCPAPRSKSPAPCIPVSWTFPTLTQLRSPLTSLSYKLVNRPPRGPRSAPTTAATTPAVPIEMPETGIAFSTSAPALFLDAVPGGRTPAPPPSSSSWPISPPLPPPLPPPPAPGWSVPPPPTPPQQGAPVVGCPVASSAAALFASEEVVLAEDNDINRAIMGRVLRGMGFRTVYLARDGLEALDLWRAHPGIAYAVLDYCMPGLDGVAVAREFAAGCSRDPTRRPTCAILLTGADECGINLAGIAAFLAKPASRQQLEVAMLRATHQWPC